MGKFFHLTTLANRLYIFQTCYRHLKSDHRLSRNYLKGSRGDRANVVLAAVGYNFAKILAGFSSAWRKFR